MFDRFFLVNASRSQVGGTGLGLAIVQSIALLHGGNVQITIKEGEGTRVVLSLPYLLPEHNRIVISVSSRCLISRAKSEGYLPHVARPISGV